LHAAVEDDHGQHFTGGLDGRGQGQRRVGADDEDIAVATGNQVLDVGDLLLVVAFRVDVDPLLDLRVQLNLGFHGVVAHHAPGVVDAGIGEAEGVGAFLGVLGRIDEVRLQVLVPRFAFRPFGGYAHQADGVVQVFLAEELAGHGRGFHAQAGAGFGRFFARFFDGLFGLTGSFFDLTGRFFGRFLDRAAAATGHQGQHQHGDQQQRQSSQRFHLDSPPMVQCEITINSQ